MTESQLCMNQVRLEQSPGTKGNDQSGSKGHQAKGLMNQKPDDINCNMEEDKNQDEKAMRMIASLQLEKRTKTKMMIKIRMMSEILRRNQAIKGIRMSMGFYRLYETRQMRLVELQVDDKRKCQLVYSIG